MTLTPENPKVHCHFVNQLVRIDPPDAGAGAARADASAPAR